VSTKSSKRVACSNKGMSKSKSAAAQANGTTRFRLEWPDGVVETEVTILDDWGVEEDDEMGIGIELKVSWHGACEQPDDWSIRWAHYFDYIAMELGEYLFTYCPAPEEILSSLLGGGLPPDLREKWLEINPDDEPDPLTGSLTKRGKKAKKA